MLAKEIRLEFNTSSSESLRTNPRCCIMTQRSTYGTQSEGWRHDEGTKK